MAMYIDSEHKDYKANQKKIKDLETPHEQLTEKYSRAKAFLPIKVTTSWNATMNPLITQHCAEVVRLSEARLR